MKPLNKFIYAIRQLPEETRLLIAAGLLVVAAFVVFAGWRAVIAERLGNVNPIEVAAGPAVGKQENMPPHTAAQPFSPSAGLVETFRSLEKFIIKPAPQENKKESSPEPQNKFAALRNAANSIWHYIADPLK